MMMQRTFTAFGLLVAACAAGCSTNVEPGSASQSAEITEAESRAHAIVWSQAQDKVSMYLDEEGHVVSKRRSFEIANGADVLRLRSLQSTAPLTCTVAWGGEEHNMDGQYLGYGLALVSASGKPEQTLVPLAPMPSDNEASSVHQGADITGSVGPYLFIREKQSMMPCGAAHGGTGIKTFVWDVTTGSVANLDLAAPDGALAKAKEELAGQGFDQDEPKLAEVIPRFDAQARLSLAYRFEKPACYACSDGKGSDYSVSATIESASISAELPASLAAFAEPPKSVAAYAAANAGVTVNGWSAIAAIGR
jgi:hypothetical protein